MNTFSTTQLLKCAMLMGSLIMPAVSWADDHLLSINGATVTQSATVPHGGTLTQPLVLSNFDGNATLTLGQLQSLTVVSTPVKMCKPGTKGNLEWLDQGNTVVGVTGVLTSGTSATVPVDGYRLTLTMTGISNTYGNVNGSCSVSGQKTYTYTKGAVIEKQTQTCVSSSNGNPIACTNPTALPSSVVFVPKLTTTYNFWNATIGSAPEPGTMFLFLIGLLGLVWLNMTRKRQTHGVSA